MGSPGRALETRLTAAALDRLILRMRLLSFIFARFGCIVAGAAILFLVAALLTVIGWVFGFTLADVDLWLEGHGGFFEAVGKLLLRSFFGLLLMLCIFLALSPFLFRGEKDENRPGWGCALLAIPAGYFCWVGTFGDY